MYCKSTEDLQEATKKILINDPNLKHIVLKFGYDANLPEIGTFSHGDLEEFTLPEIGVELRGGCEFSHGDLEEFTRAMETSSITNLQLKIYLQSRASIEKYHPFIKRIVQCHSIHDLILKGDFPSDNFASFVEALSHNSSIQNLKIRLNDGLFGSKAAASIAKCLRSKTSSLKSLDIMASTPNDGLGAVMEALHNYPSLKTLNLTCSYMVRDDAVAIGNLLQSAGCAIEELDISDENYIGDEEEVMAGVLENSSIRVLRMGRCDVSSEGAEFIANALCSGKCTIEELYLHGNFELEDEGCVLIMKALKNNNSIFKLDLSYCGIGDVGMRGISQILQNNHAPCLRTLSLCSNQNIGLEGFKAIAIAISQNSSLEDLDLSQCHVCDGGCIALMNALSQNSTLKALNLECCRIRNEGGKAVANFLKSNVGSIHELNLKTNNLNEESLIEIAHALHFNTHLTKLSLGDKGDIATEEFWITFDDAAHHNYSLQELDIGHKFKDYGKSIEKNLDLNKKLGPVKAEMVKTGSFPCWILPVLMTASCFVEVLSKVTSLGHLSPVFDLICKQPTLFDFNYCVGERPTKKVRME